MEGERKDVHPQFLRHFCALVNTSTGESRQVANDGQSVGQSLPTLSASSEGVGEGLSPIPVVSSYFSV